MNDAQPNYELLSEDVDKKRIATTLGIIKA